MGYFNQYRIWSFFSKEARQMPTTANMLYLLISSLVFTRAGLHLFRYRKISDYDLGEYKGEFTNWFSLADLIRNYVDLSLYGIMALTQLMATFGLFTGINLLVW